jgi:hypothetical protein
LHIGTHKTGTTALQEGLASSYTPLQESGILFPIAGRVSTISGHHNIAWELIGDPRFWEEKGTLADACLELENSECHSAILSSEDFEYLHQWPDKLATIKSSFEDVGYRVEVVMFFRDKESYTKSLYLQLLRHGLEKPLEDFVEEVDRTGAFVMNEVWRFCFNHEEIVHAFSEVFGKDSVHCGEYAHPIQIPFSQICGLCGVNLKPPYLVRNQTSSREGFTPSQST